MKLVRIYALRSDRKRLLEHLQMMGVMQIAPPEEAERGFHRIDTASKAHVFDRNAAAADQALDIIQRYAPKKKGLLDSFAGRREINSDEFNDCVNKRGELKKLCRRIIELDKQIADNAAETVRTRASIEQLKPWRNFDVPLNCGGTRSTAVFIGSLPQKYTSQELATAIAESDNELVFDYEIVSTTETMTCIMVVVTADMRDRAETVLRLLGFAKPMGADNTLPSDKIKLLDEKLEKLKQDSADAKSEIEALAQRRREIEDVSDYYKARSEKYTVIGEIDHSKHVFIITGYAAEEDCARLKSELTDLCDCVVEFYDTDPETAPVKLRNNAFNAPTESIVEMYSMPGPDDIDPTPLMAFFFYFFFGMMFSDAGYGLIMMIATTLILKKFKPEKAMTQNMKMFRLCGVSTFLWGLVFGSFFGDAPAVIAKNYFGTDFQMPALISPINDALTLMIISIAFGFVQIMVGIGAKFYVLWKQGDRLGAVFDCGFWMTLLTGLGVLSVGIVVPVCMKIGAVISILSAIGLVATQGRKSKGVMKFFSGLASLYDVTGYISDLMSYTRLFALGLTTGVMGQVFNVLATMFGNSIPSLIPMILIFVLGHVINFALNALGSYVHTMRLQYVEMFGKFYEGGGKKFEPFALDSKYTRIQEETKSC